MFKKLITSVAITLGIAILTACSGEEPASETGIKTDEPRRETTVAAPASTTAPEPTRPQRLDQLLTPAAAPEATTVEPATKTTQRERKNGAEPGAMPAPTSMPGLPIMKGPAIEDLVPEDPKTNDRVLLQDIYGQIDLEQFALDPNEPIPAVDKHQRIREHNRLGSRMNYEETGDHPYLHLFPHLKNVIENRSRYDEEEILHYNPSIGVHGSYKYGYGSWHQSRDNLRKVSSDTRSHLIYFIYNPWFDPILEEFHRQENPNLKYRNAEKITPYWFGNNSTRGVLVETVAALLEEAKIPTAEPATRPWTPDKEDAPINIYRREIDTAILTEREWTMEEYIRMPVQPNLQGEDHIFQRYQAPYVEWEFLHTQLPILKITAHANQNLPLNTPEGGRAQGGTEYSVSFLISLQNRWISFDEPNRWIIRFQEDLQTPYSFAENNNDGFLRPHVLNPDLPYPKYWDDTDYMQHRIIGPVVLTVHESPVLLPGTYSRIPRITHWEAPGYIITDKQAKTARWGGYRKFNPETRRWDWVDPETGEKKAYLEVTRPGLRYIPHRYYYGTGVKNPNVGFPLPGHVMTTSATGPGTEVWREYKMESWEEYDRSLGEP